MCQIDRSTHLYMSMLKALMFEMVDCAESINRLCDLGYRLVRCNLIPKSDDYLLKFCKP